MVCDRPRVPLNAADNLHQHLLEGFRYTRSAMLRAQNAKSRQELLAVIWPEIILVYRDGVGEGQYAAGELSPSHDGIGITLRSQ